jgi:hypothetical protein
MGWGDPWTDTREEGGGSVNGGGPGRGARGGVDSKRRQTEAGWGTLLPGGGGRTPGTPGTRIRGRGSSGFRVGGTPGGGGGRGYTLG